MNVFDSEMGPVCPTNEAERIQMLAQAGLTLAQCRAWHSVTHSDMRDDERRDQGPGEPKDAWQEAWRQ